MVIHNRRSEFERKGGESLRVVDGYSIYLRVDHYTTYRIHRFRIFPWNSKQVSETVSFLFLATSEWGTKES
jgi:hypothetical protein